MEMAKTLVSSFVCSRLDYCITVFAGLPVSTIELPTASMMLFMPLDGYYQDITSMIILSTK